MTILIAAILWWTLSVIIFMAIMNEQSHSGVGALVETITVSTLWPVFVPFVVIGLLYQSVVKSTAQLRNDLRNRKLLAEFEAWLKEQNKNE
jgi:hypothetical protein